MDLHWNLIGGDGQLKRKKTTLLVTINTNKRPSNSTVGQQSAGQLEMVIKSFLTDEMMRKALPIMYDDIDMIDSEYGIEIGRSQKGRRIHAHVYLDISHHGMFRLADAHAKIRAVFKMLAPNENYYINVKLIPNNPSENAKNYVKKTQGAHGSRAIMPGVGTVQSSENTYGLNYLFGE